MSADTHLCSARWAGVAWARRPTGGRSRALGRPHRIIYGDGAPIGRHGSVLLDKPAPRAARIRDDVLHAVWPARAAMSANRAPSAVLHEATSRIENDAPASSCAWEPFQALAIMCPAACRRKTRVKLLSATKRGVVSVLQMWCQK